MHPAEDEDLFLVVYFGLAIEAYFMFLESCSVKDAFVDSG